MRARAWRNDVTGDGSNSPESGWDIMARLRRLSISYDGATYDSSAVEVVDAIPPSMADESNDVRDRRGWERRDDDDDGTRNDDESRRRHDSPNNRRQRQ